MNFDVELAASVSLLAFAALAFVDGVVLHFFLERLPFRPGSRLEHALHTARALLFPPVLLTFFDARASLTTGLVLLTVDTAFEVWDMLIERQSRTFSGGLRTHEYATHAVLVARHANPNYLRLFVVWRPFPAKTEGAPDATPGSTPASPADAHRRPAEPRLDSRCADSRQSSTWALARSPGPKGVPKGWSLAGAQ
jgi:hypothetical protein